MPKHLLVIQVSCTSGRDGVPFTALGIKHAFSWESIIKMHFVQHSAFKQDFFLIPL
eukprot:c3119_g1_i1 orf=63-230(+)